MTYLTRRTGKVLHLEDTVLGTVEFRTASQMAKNENLRAQPTYAIELTQVPEQRAALEQHEAVPRDEPDRRLVRSDRVLSPAATSHHAWTTDSGS
jgi:hypothetical protein